MVELGVAASFISSIGLRMTDRFLITGAQGFIGRYLCSHLLDQFPAAKILGVGRSPENNLAFRYSVTHANTKVPAPVPEKLRIIRDSRYSYVSCDLSSLSTATVFQKFSPA